MKRLTTRGPATAEAIRDRVPFTTSGALRAVAKGDSGFWNTGRLSAAEYEMYHTTVDTMDYVVFSYNTPIAWHSAAGWHKVAQRFSVTTSKHQGNLYLIGA